MLSAIVKRKPSNDRPTYFNFSVLRLKSLRMILLLSGIGAIGAYTPLFYLEIKMLRLIILKKNPPQSSYTISPAQLPLHTHTRNKESSNGQ